MVFDVKTGNGAFLAGATRREAGRLLVETCGRSATGAVAMVTDMSQPLGAGADTPAEVLRHLRVGSRGDGAAGLLEVTSPSPTRRALAGTTADAASSRARSPRSGARAFDALGRGAGRRPAWLRQPDLPLAPLEVVLEAPRSGKLAAVETRQLGMLLAEAGGGRCAPAAASTPGSPCAPRPPRRRRGGRR